jgi:MarR family transcriptional regulator, organic hydroperoxide resistance regulator
MSREKTQRPFLENYLAFLLAKTSHLISSGFHRELTQRDISISTWRILAVVNDRDRTVGELADLVLLNQPTLSKTLDKLEAEGLVARERDENHRRSVIIRITDKGEKLVAKLIPLANRHEKQVFSHLNDQQKKNLIELLQQTIQHNQ